VNSATFIDEGKPWESAMKIVLREMLECDSVSLLPNWSHSRGAKIEERVAHEIRMEMRDHWGWEANTEELI